ncbi:MAG: hypothetical protein ACQERR_07245 [Pseudomonadota bacterium]
MRRPFRLITLAGLLFLLAACGEPDERDRPWDVAITPEGKPRVADITLGETTLSEVEGRQFSRMQIALFEDDEGHLAAEAFFKEMNFGGLHGRLHANLAVSRETLESMRDDSLKRESGDSATGARNYRVTEENIERLREKPVESLTFIPFAEFSEELIIRYFGEPDERYRGAGRQVHYQYPERGIEVVHDPDGKEVIQYVHPRDFSRLREPWADEH